MAYRKEIETTLLKEAKKKMPPLVAHIRNYPEFNQKDVYDTAQKLINEKKINATLHFHYEDLCTITFAPSPIT